MSLLNDITIRRFWSKVSIQDNGCWNYDHGFQWERGYPCFWFEGKTWRAGRFALWLFAGSPPENKPHALHKCNNPQCVNPAHLYWGDEKDNYEDMKKDNPASAHFKAQFQKGHVQFWNGNRVLTEIQVSYIKRLCEAKYTDREIARWYGVAHNVIKNIRLEKTFKYVEPCTIRRFEGNLKKPDPSMAGRRSLNSHDVRDIKKLLKEGRPKNEIAKIYNVCQPTIHKIMLGKRWANVTV